MDDDFVETSDVEELEEIRALRDPFSSSKDQLSPRKRLTIFTHLSPEPTTSETEQTGIFTPASHSRFSTPATLFSTELPSENPVSPAISSDFPESSQDPLLLCEAAKHEDPIEGDNTRRNVGPLHLLSNEDQPSELVELMPVEHLPSEDDLLDFGGDFQTPSSPLSSPPAPSRSPSKRPHSRSATHSPYQSVEQDLPLMSPRNPSPAPVMVEDAISGANQSRYPLRARKAHQERPYEYDRRKYKQELRHNPEAIITLPVERRRHSEHYEEEEESQELYDLPSERSEGEEQEDADRGSRRDWVDDEQFKNPFDGLLPDLPSSSEDEDISALRREVRIQKREAKRAQEQGNKKERQQAKNAFKASPKKTNVRRAGSYHESKEQGGRTLFSSNPQVSGPSRLASESSPPQGVDNPHSFFVDDAGRTSRVAQAQSSKYDDLWAASPRSGSSRVGDKHSMNFTRDGESSEPPLNSDEISFNTQDTAIVVDGNSDSSDSDEEDKQARRKLRYLKRMYPKFMWPMLEAGSARTSQPPPQRRRAELLSDDDDLREPVPRPGRARASKRGVSRPIVDIKGDSESSDENNEPALPRHSPSNMASSLFSDHESSPPAPIIPLPPGSHEIIEISDDSEGESSAEDAEIDDEDLQWFLHTDKPHDDMHRSRLARESLVDYMLSKNVSFNRRKKGKRKARDESPATRRSRSKKPRYKYDIVTAGNGGGQQTLLSFNRPHRPKDDARSELTPRSPSPALSPPISRTRVGRGDSMNWDNVAGGDFVRPPREYTEKSYPKQKTWKEKLKERKERAKTHDVYVVQAEGGVRLTNGLREPDEMKTRRSRIRRRKHVRVFQIDDKDKDFCNAITSSSLDICAKPPTLPGCERARRVVPLESDLPATFQNGQTSDSDAFCAASKLNIPALHPGVSFGKSTFIGRGLLHELLQRSRQHPTIDGTCRVRDFEFGPDVTISQFEGLLPRICAALIKFATDLPNDDDNDELREWEIVMRKTCELLSWLLSTTQDCDLAHLKNIVHQQLKSMVSRLRAAAFTRSSMDLTTLSVCWFSVVLSLHVSGSSPNQILREPCEVLIHYLLEYGLDRTMSFFQGSGRTFDSSSLAQRTAELWVCVIQVMYDGFNKEDSNLAQTDMFWLMVRTDIESRITQKTKLQGSELIWHTVFSLCALSQFSAGGVATSTPRLPAAWNIVELAFKQIRLTVDANIEERLESSALEKRDRYLALVISRSFHLVNRCKWKLDNASPMLSALAKIFQSRRYGNLRHERPDFPEFLRTQTWEQCNQYNRRDPSFVLFLKLVIQAVKTVSSLPEVQMNSKVNKLLSFIIPVGALPFSRAKLPTEHELSMLYNRIAAVAVTLHLRPQEQEIRVRQAHEYAKFEDSSFMARLASIRSLNFLTQIVVLEREPLSKEVLTWFMEIADVLLGEFKELRADPSTAQGQVGRNRDHVLFLISMLLGAVRHVMNAHRDSGSGAIYPDPALLDSIRKIYNDSGLTQNPKVARELHGVVRSFLAVRAALVPPQRPSIAVDEEESQESQDDWDALLNDPQFLSGMEGTPLDSYREKDKQASNALKSITWTLFRRLNRYFEQPYPSSEVSLSNHFMRDIDDWLDTWLECASVVISLRQSFTWYHACFSLRGDAWGKVANVRWRRRLDVRIVYRVLQLDPVAYQEYREEFLQTLFQALVPEEVTIEHEFLSLLFTLDRMQHPLFRGLPIPAPEPIQSKTSDRGAGSRVEYRFTAEQFRTLRLPILRGILANIAASLDNAEVTKDETHIAENTRYTAWVIGKLLSVMSGIHSTLKENSVERRQYDLACKEVVKAVCEEQPKIRALHQMEYWAAWGTSLG